MCLISQHPTGKSRKPRPWAQTTPKNAERKISHWIFPFSMRIQAHTMLPNPFCSPDITRSKAQREFLGVFPPLAAPGRYPSQSWNTRCRFWQGKGKQFYFSRVFSHSFGSTTLITRLCGHGKSHQRGESVSHTSGEGEAGVFLRCVSTDTSFLSTTGPPGHAGPLPPSSSQGSR